MNEWMNDWMDRQLSQFIRRHWVAKHNLGKGIQISYSSQIISFLIFWIITFFICQHFSIVPKINTYSLPWPNQGTAYVHNFAEKGLSEKNTLSKQRSSKNVKLRKMKSFCSLPAPREIFCQNRWRWYRSSEEFLAVFIFLYFLRLWVHFIFNRKYRRLELVLPRVSDRSEHMSPVMLASDCKSCVEVSSSPYIKVCLPL